MRQRVFFSRAATLRNISLFFLIGLFSLLFSVLHEGEYEFFSHQAAPSSAPLDPPSVLKSATRILGPGSSISFLVLCDTADPGALKFLLDSVAAQGLPHDDYEILLSEGCVEAGFAAPPLSIVVRSAGDPLRALIAVSKCQSLVLLVPGVRALGPDFSSSVRFSGPRCQFCVPSGAHRAIIDRGAPEFVTNSDFFHLISEPIVPQRASVLHGVMQVGTISMDPGVTGHRTVFPVGLALSRTQDARGEVLSLLPTSSPSAQIWALPCGLVLTPSGAGLALPFLPVPLVVRRNLALSLPPPANSTSSTHELLRTWALMLASRVSLNELRGVPLAAKSFETFGEGPGPLLAPSAFIDAIVARGMAWWDVMSACTPPR